MADSDSDQEFEEIVEEEPVETEDELETTDDEGGDSPEDFDFIEPDTKNVLHKDIIIVDPSKRRTSHIMTKTEMTEAVSIRATQIANDSVVFVDISGMTNPIKMAQKELNEGKCPLILRRKVGEIFEGDKLKEFVEYWDVNKMAKSVVYKV